MDSVPIGIKGLALAVVLLLAVELGWRVCGWVSSADLAGGDGTGGQGWNMLVAGALTLLSLLIGFTVNMAVERFEHRRLLVIDEANAITTTYLRAELFSEPARDRLTSAIARYGRDRAAMFWAGDDTRRIARVSAQTEADKEAVWRATDEATAQPADARLTTAALISTNDMFNLAAVRQAAREIRVPDLILLVLVAYAVATAGVVGFALRTMGRRHPGGTAVFFLMVTMSVVVILSLDQPRAGGIVVMEGPLDRANTSILHAESAKARPAPDSSNVRKGP
jgi:hypothetical protein